jgi:hypothetical protein
LPSRLVDVLLALPDVPLRTASFSLADRWLVWTEARLYANRLVLTGWGLWERYWHSIPFEAIEGVEHTNAILIIHRKDGRALRLYLDAARRWHTAIEAHRAVYDP